MDTARIADRQHHRLPQISLAGDRDVDAPDQRPDRAVGLQIEHATVVDASRDLAADVRDAREIDRLEEADGNKSKAATKLNITRKTLYAWLRGDGG